MEGSIWELIAHLFSLEARCDLRIVQPYVGEGYLVTVKVPKSQDRWLIVKRSKRNRTFNSGNLSALARPLGNWVNKLMRANWTVFTGSTFTTS